MSFKISARIRHFFESISNCELKIHQRNFIENQFLFQFNFDLFYPFHQAKNIFPKWPAPSLSTCEKCEKFASITFFSNKLDSDYLVFTHVTVADSGLTISLPTPTPFRIACVESVPDQSKWKEWHDLTKVENERISISTKNLPFIVEQKAWIVSQNW